MQNGMVSVERILNMCALPSEHLDKGHIQTPSGWPSKGGIRFDNFSLRYDDSLALREITANIDGNQKALFRMNKASTGRIFIDGVDINCLQLRDLRSHLAIIPQEPVLFVGTVRRNLDPFNEYSDEALWTALDQVELKV
ncbi:unnamed protein product, partial [Mesorhabditis spiculigera]